MAAVKPTIEKIKLRDSLLRIPKKESASLPASIAVSAVIRIAKIREGNTVPPLINNITGWMFFYLQYKSIRIAMGQGTDLGWAMWIFIGLLMATVIYLVAQARRIA